MSQWVRDFCLDYKKQSDAYVWIRLTDHPREYWCSKILFEIACAIRMPISLDEPTRNRVLSTSVQ